MASKNQTSYDICMVTGTILFIIETFVWDFSSFENLSTLVTFRPNFLKLAETTLSDMLFHVTVLFFVINRFPQQF